MLQKRKSLYRICEDKGKCIPIQDWAVCYGSRRLRIPKFIDNQYMKAARLSALGTDSLYPEKTSSVLISVGGSVHSQGHSAAGRIESVKMG